jgi:hypothetical protein
LLPIIIRVAQVGFQVLIVIARYMGLCCVNINAIFLDGQISASSIKNIRAEQCHILLGAAVQLFSLFYRS